MKILDIDWNKLIPVFPTFFGCWPTESMGKKDAKFVWGVGKGTRHESPPASTLSHFLAELYSLLSSYIVRGPHSSSFV